MIHGVTPLSLSLAGQTLDLFPDGAAWWREQGILILADCHFGKSASFRHHGVAVPEGGTVDDLERIDRLLARTGAGQLLVVGDFFHAPTGYSDEVMAWLMAWRERHADLRVTLVPGNHDRWLHRLPSRLALEIVPGVHQLGVMGFVHDPASVAPVGQMNPAPLTEGATAASAWICGHLHPAVRLGGRRERGLKAPCFWLQREAVLVLPGFGSFTGTAVITPGAGDRVFAAAGGRVMEVPARLMQRSFNTPGKADNPQ
jgi:DNA ligase-associated metallophosphoesterase